MADVAASIGGLISLSIQLVEKAESIRAFCSRSKAAPQTLLSLSERLETLSILLRQLAAFTQQNNPDAELLRRCVARLQATFTQIERLVKHLDRWLSRTGIFGKVAVALRDGEIRDLLEEVEQAETSITLALLMFISPKQTQHANQHFAAVYSQLDDIQCSMRSISATLSNETQIRMLTTQPLVSMAGRRLLEGGEAAMASTSSPIACQERTVHHDPWTSKRASRSSRQLKKYAKASCRISINMTWMTGKVWQMALYQAETGWDFCVRSWNLRSKNAEIFKYCRSGNINAVQALLKSGQASAYDYYHRPGGLDGSKCGEMTLLHVAAREGHLDMCKFLLTETSLGHTGKAVEALDTFAVAFNHYVCPDADPIAMYRLFFDNSDTNTDMYELHASNMQYPMWLKYTAINETCSRLIQNSQFTDYKRWPINLRIENTMRIFEHSSWSTYRPEHLLQWIGETACTELTASYRRDDGCTLLHLMVRGSLIRKRRKNSMLVDTITNFILLGADLSATWRGETPFMLLMRIGESLSERCCYFHFLSSLRKDIALWRAILRRSGVSFPRFLRSEKIASKEMVAMDRYYNDRERLALRGWKFDERSRKWDLEVYWIARISVYRLYPMPGSWELGTRQIQTICSDASAEECYDTGHWIESAEVLVGSEPFALAQTQPELLERACYKLLMKSQDDHGLIALRVNQRKRLPALRRSSSFASPTKPSCSRQEKQLRCLRIWLPTAHVCPYDGRLRFRCKSNGSFAGAIETDCYRGICSGCSLQESRDWRIGSFERRT